MGSNILAASIATSGRRERLRRRTAKGSSYLLLSVVSLAEQRRKMNLQNILDQLSLLLLPLLLRQAPVDAFSPTGPVARRLASQQRCHAAATLATPTNSVFFSSNHHQRLISRSSSASTQLGMARSTDGTDVGIYILGFVFAICIWLFTIPPSFRRSNICTVSPEVAPAVNCVSLQEWISDVGDYYKGGGGIQWDFSIDPATLAKNEEMKQALLGGGK